MLTFFEKNGIVKKYEQYFNNMTSDINELRKFLQRRIMAGQGWFIRMSIVTMIISISMAILMSQCSGMNLLQGAELGLLCAIPMLFVLWLPMLFSLFCLEITRSTEFHNLLREAVPPFCPFATDGYLQVPYFPPRFSLA